MVDDLNILNMIIAKTVYKGNGWSGESSGSVFQSFCLLLK